MKWHKGAPPAIGWWPCSVFFGLDSWRWWDGRRWSFAAYDTYSAEQAAQYVNCKEGVGAKHQISWRDWPKKLRHLPGYPLSIPSQGPST